MDASPSGIKAAKLSRHIWVSASVQLRSTSYWFIDQYLDQTPAGRHIWRPRSCDPEKSRYWPTNKTAVLDKEPQQWHLWESSGNIRKWYWGLKWSRCGRSPVVPMVKWALTGMVTWVAPADIRGICWEECSYDPVCLPGVGVYTDVTWNSSLHDASSKGKCLCWQNTFSSKWEVQWLNGVLSLIPPGYCTLTYEYSLYNHQPRSFSTLALRPVAWWPPQTLNDRSSAQSSLWFIDFFCCNETAVSPHFLKMVINANACPPQYSPWGKAYML